jgi:hypothetical protein
MKDVECAFGLLKKRFNILAIPGWFYFQCTLGLTIDDECDNSFNENYHTTTSVLAPPINYETSTSLTSILYRETELTSGLMFSHLQSHLIEYVWNKFH